MPADRFVEALNAQIGNELAAHNQYLACAVHYDAETMPRMAAFFYGQALEERDHAMMMVQYLLDTDADVAIPGVEAERAARVVAAQQRDDLGDRRAEADFSSRLAILDASRLRLTTALGRAERSVARARSAGSASTGTPAARSASTAASTSSA